MTVLNHIKTWVMTLAISLAALGFVVAVVPQMQRRASLEQRLQDLQQERDREEARLQELRVRQQRFQTDRDYVQRVAHQIGMVRENEVIFRFYEDDSRVYRRHGD